MTRNNQQEATSIAWSSDKQFTDQCKQHSSLDLLMTIIFKMGFRVWKQYNGQVPREEFARLEEASDWPTGLARHVFKRLDEDEELRHKLKSI
jgi:hypothetical protein